MSGGTPPFHLASLWRVQGRIYILYRQKVLPLFSYNKSQLDALFLNFILVKSSTCFDQIYCPSSGVLVLYSQQYVFVILVMFTVC